MPKLLSFLACEKIIVSKDETPTIVSVVQTVKTSPVGPQNPEIPPDAMAPFHWAMFSIWECEESELGKQFHQKNQIIMPDGTVNPNAQGDLPFTAKTGLNFNYVNVFGFPVGREGILKIRMWLEFDGQTISEHFYPINVERMPTLPTPDITVTQ